MIFDISDQNFKKMFKNNQLYLPIRWDGYNFVSTLEQLYHLYQICIYEVIQKDSVNIDIERIKSCCSLIIKSVKYYLNGFPSRAYNQFEGLMRLLMRKPLKLYRKSVSEVLGHSGYHDRLNLYRVVGVSDNYPYDRKRVFHTPYNLRSKVSTSRYSIAGYPSLYLGTSIELCQEEVRLNPYDKFSIVSLFKIERNLEFCDTEVNVIELGLKPQDFTEEANMEMSRRHFSRDLLNDPETKKAYLMWYPLIAACSYIRVNKFDPFAAEYVIPQLMMQWVRSELEEKSGSFDKLIGIRYFSCASIRASELGFNYVFPTSGKQEGSLPFCSVLTKAFKLTNPVYIHEYNSVLDCERYLNRQAVDNVKY